MAPLARQVAGQFEQAHAALRVDADGGLVEQQNLRAVHDAAGEVEAALHAAAEARHGFAGAVGKADEVEHFLDAVAKRGAVHPVRAAPVGEVLGGGEIVVERDVLGHHAERLACTASVGAVSCPMTETRPAVGFRSPQMQLMQVVLPAPLGPSRPKISPGWAVKERSSTATTLP